MEPYFVMLWIKHITSIQKGIRKGGSAEKKVWDSAKRIFIGFATSSIGRSVIEGDYIFIPCCVKSVQWVLFVFDMRTFQAIILDSMTDNLSYKEETQVVVCRNPSYICILWSLKLCVLFYLCLPCSSNLCRLIYWCRHVWRPISGGQDRSCERGQYEWESRRWGVGGNIVGERRRSSWQLHECLFGGCLRLVFLALSEHSCSLSIRKLMVLLSLRDECKKSQ